MTHSQPFTTAHPCNKLPVCPTCRSVPGPRDGGHRVNRARVPPGSTSECGSPSASLCLLLHTQQVTDPRTEGPHHAKEWPPLAPWGQTDSPPSALSAHGHETPVLRWTSIRGEEPGECGVKVKPLCPRQGPATEPQKSGPGALQEPEHNPQGRESQLTNRFQFFLIKKIIFN